jgi:hypothetical protein
MRDSTAFNLALLPPTLTMATGMFPTSFFQEEEKGEVEDNPVGFGGGLEMDSDLVGIMDLQLGLEALCLEVMECPFPKEER